METHRTRFLFSFIQLRHVDVFVITYFSYSFLRHTAHPVILFPREFSDLYKCLRVVISSSWFTMFCWGSGVGFCPTLLHFSDVGWPCLHFSYHSIPYAKYFPSYLVSISYGVPFKWMSDILLSKIMWKHQMLYSIPWKKIIYLRDPICFSFLLVDVPQTRMNDSGVFFVVGAVCPSK